MQFGDRLNQALLVHLIRQFGDDDRLATVVVGFDLRPGAHQNAPAAGFVRFDDARRAIDDAAGGKIRTGHQAQQFVEAEFRRVDQRDRRVDDFTQVVRRHVGRHADRDAGRTVDEQIRDARRQHRRLAFLLVVVELEIDGLLVDVGEQVGREALEAALGITHRRGVVAVNRAEVALSIDQRIAQRKILRHAH